MEAGPSRPRASSNSTSRSNVELKYEAEAEDTRRLISDKDKDKQADGEGDEDGMGMGIELDGGLGDGSAGVGEGEGHQGHRHATLAQRKAIWWRNVLITGTFVLSWYIFATLLSLYNKWMFSPQYYGFGYPLFVTACHMVVQFVLAAVIRLVWPRQFRPVERPTRQEYLTKVFPAAASTGGDIGLSNLSLKTITLSLYTMCKSSTLIFVLLVAFALRLEQYSLRLISVITLISFGVFCMVFNTTAVSISGILMVFSASALAGVRWGLTELLMHKKAMGLSNPFATIFWLAPLMALTLAVVSMAIEGWFQILSSDFFTGVAAVRTMGVILLPGAIAFAMVASEYFIIQRAGVVPMSIAGIFKEVSTISISAWVFGDQLTQLNIIGVLITVCGIALYSWHKYQKSINSTLELDAHGKPIPIDDNDTSPLMAAPPHFYATAPVTSTEINELPPRGDKERGQHSYPPAPEQEAETAEERANRLRDDFEGWDRGQEWSDEEEDDDEVERRMIERQSANANRSGSGTGLGTNAKWDGRSWGEWWEKEM